MSEIQAASEAIIQREDAEGVTTLWLNRPRRYNALSQELLTVLQHEFDDIATDSSVRVVVLGARGKAFCAGHDLKQMRAAPSQGYYEDLFAQCSRMMMTINQIPQPVIARVQGLATAAGLPACCCL